MKCESIYTGHTVSERTDTGTATLAAAAIIICLSISGVAAIGLWYGFAAADASSVNDAQVCRLAAATSAFTLVEVSIVLVVIGLLIGGVLVGRDLIGAATVRSQLSQIERARTAVNVFRNKFNALPGDLSATEAATLGFTARNYFSGTYLADDHPGDGKIGPWNSVTAGEHALFWSDLSKAGLISGSFSGRTDINGCDDYDPGQGWMVPTDTLAPKGVIGNHLFAYSGQVSAANVPGYDFNIVNTYLHFTISPSVCQSIGTPYAWRNESVITSRQAAQMDVKADDGKPLTGVITAQGWGEWALTWSWSIDTDFPSATGSGYDQNIPNDARYCYHNGNNSSRPMVYGASDEAACVISFKGE